MTESSHLRRRGYLAATAGLLATNFLAESAAAEDKSAERFVVQSQKLPATSVTLSTDRLPVPQGRKMRIVALATAWCKYLHADDSITKFIEGYGIAGRTDLRHCRVVRLYVEQFPDSDILRGMAARYRTAMFKPPATQLM